MFFSPLPHEVTLTKSTHGLAAAYDTLRWAFSTKLGGVFREVLCFSLSRSGTRATARNEMMLPTDYLCLLF